MSRFFIEPEQIQGDRIYIRGTDVNHIKNVLRMKPGDELSLSDGETEREYRVGILNFLEDEIECELRFIKEASVELPCKVYLFQGLPKQDKMELVIQKAVELGAYCIVPVAMSRCVVKLDDKKKQSKTARWQAICEAAAKQSKRGLIPQVMPVMDFDEALELAKELDVKLLPYELAEDIDTTRKIIEKIEPGQRVGIFIGPEGGFDPKEVEAAKKTNFIPITLGRRILRTETAGMAMLSILMYCLEK